MHPSGFPVAEDAHAVAAGEDLVEMRIEACAGQVIVDVLPDVEGNLDLLLVSRTFRRR
jgi:hypothetical protein